MKNKISAIKIFFLTSFSFLLFSGCGDGSGTKTIELLEGIFVDSPVKGLYYTTSTQSGYTDVDGKFKYKPGENITFYLGNLPIGSSNGKNLVTVIDLNNDNYSNLDTLSNKSINTLRLLQSLDKDNELSNGIDIVDEINDLNLTATDMQSEVDLQDLLDNLNTTYGYSKTLISNESAKLHFAESIEAINTIYTSFEYFIDIRISVVGNNVTGTLQEGSDIYNIYGKAQNNGKFVLETNSIDGYYFVIELQKDSFDNYIGTYIKYDHMGDPYDYFYTYDGEYSDETIGFDIEFYLLDEYCDN